MAAVADGPDLGASTIATVSRRLIPFLFLLFVVNFLDRVNVGFAALQMNADLRFTPEVFGLGVGLFFVAYVLFEIPSNLLLQRFGARLWIARIMVTWGLVSAAMAFVAGPRSFYLLRFLLGLAEAGFVPGVLLYLGQWFPEKARAAAAAKFMMASAISIVIGAPLSGAVMSLGGWMGLAGWQWMFILEGVPAVLLGVAVPFVLADRPADAAWLGAAQREWLTSTLQQEAAAKRATGLHGVGPALASPAVWLLGATYACIGVGFYGISLWLPQILRQMSGLGPLALGLLTALPFAGAAVAMVANGRHSDRTGERRWHLAVPCLLGAAGFGVGALAANPAVAFLGICLGAAGIWGGIGVFWSLPMAALGGTAAAAGIALINALGNIGGFAGPYLIGWLRARTPDFNASLLLIAGFLVLAGGLAFALQRRTGKRAAVPAAF